MLAGDDDAATTMTPPPPTIFLVRWATAAIKTPPDDDADARQVEFRARPISKFPRVLRAMAMLTWKVMKMTI